MEKIWTVSLPDHMFGKWWFLFDTEAGARDFGNLKEAEVSYQEWDAQALAAVWVTDLRKDKANV